MLDLPLPRSGRLGQCSGLPCRPLSGSRNQGEAAILRGDAKNALGRAGGPAHRRHAHPGFTGVELANLANEAALHTKRQSSEAVSVDNTCHVS
jgi:hypothetical protein